MKPFNLEEALAGKPVITRDLRKVTEIHHFTKASEDVQFTLYAVVEGLIHAYTLNGSFFTQGTTSDSDLFMEEPVVEKWFNVYRQTIKGTEISVGEGYYTYEEAIKMGGRLDNYIKTIKVDNKPF